VGRGDPFRHDRRGMRHMHDLTDEEWTEVESLILPAKPGGSTRGEFWRCQMTEGGHFQAPRSRPKSISNQDGP
jgi:hypothetical protein